MSLPLLSGVWRGSLIVAIGLVVGLAQPGLAESVSGDGEQADEPQDVEISVALGSLRREVTSSFRRGREWPREVADFAQQRNWRVDVEELNEVLLRRLHRNPVIEGYIKWQLLSFGPDFSRYDDDQWQQLMDMAPEPLAVPSPRPEPARGGDFRVSFFSGRQLSHVRTVQAVVGDGVAIYRPRMGVISAGGILEIEGTRRPDFSAEGVVLLNRELADARHHVRYANRPLIAYRNALLEHVPEEGGKRFAAILREIHTRLNARDSSAADLVDHLLQVGPALVDELDEQTRVTLLEWADDLAGREIAYTRAFDTNLRGELVANIDPLALPREPMERLMLLIEDPEAYRREYGEAGEPTAPPGLPDPAEPPVAEPPGEPEAVTDPTS